MSSSTSSSERSLPRLAPAAKSRRALLVGAVTLAVLIALELAARLWLVPASKDLSRLGAYPDRARALMARGGARVALIGNSATEEGVDPQLLGRALGARLGRPVHADLFVADSAEIDTMYWLVERAFWKQSLAPELLVVTFFDRGLEDGTQLDVGRLGRFLTGPEDWAALFRLDVGRLEERADVVVSSGSAAFAARRRIKERTLVALPGYKLALGRINRVNFEHDRVGRYAPVDLPHEGLRRFVRRAVEHGVPVCFVAYPKQDRYEIAPEARRIIEEAGMLLLDLRGLTELRPEHYADNIHLNARGRGLYTEALARALADTRRW